MISTPKIKKNKLTGKASWYPYYAGYSEKFVIDIIKYLGIQENDIILDPWNGSGTTTSVAAEHNINAFGFDLNPVMNIVASSKLLVNANYTLLFEHALDIFHHAKSYKKHFKTTEDPLNAWFNHKTIRTFRKLEIFILENHPKSSLPPINAFYYVALFRTLKLILKSFKSTNPVWIKTASSPTDKISPSDKLIYDTFVSQVDFMAKYFKENNIEHYRQKELSKICCANSAKLPLDDNSVDFVITSPPYCTRLDYVVATLPELALYGIGYDIRFKKLRYDMLGTNLILKENIAINHSWGNLCLDTLNVIYNHSTKASRSYYYKTFIQYFNNLYLSLSEIARVIKRNGIATIVVQDSYYKEIHINLPEIIKEMMLSLNFDGIYEKKFINKNTFSSLNPKSKPYRKTFYSTETVLFFKKGFDKNAEK